MHFEEAYPNKPPGVKFISQMFHPNVYGSGELCLDILQNRWSPTYDVAAILTSVQRYVQFLFLLFSSLGDSLLDGVREEEGHELEGWIPSEG